MDKNLIDIFDISYEGAGVGKIDSKIVFVPKSLVGEQVKAEIIKTNNSFSVGKLLEVCCSSKKRIKPFCPYFEICGGCDFQHCSYEHEQFLKVTILKREISKVFECEDIQIFASPKRFFYRNKIKLEVKDDEVGYLKAKSHIFFPIQKCPIASEQINNCIDKLRLFLKQVKFKGLKSVYLKEVDGNVSICFLFNKTQQKQNSHLDFSILEGFSVFFCFGDVLESNETKIIHVYGKLKTNKIFKNLLLPVEVSAFNQINDDVATALYEYVCDLMKNKRVVNAYSGQGLLTLLLSKESKFVYGIEFLKNAHESAEKLMQNEKDYKTQNICGKVEECLGQILQRDKIDAIVLDPSREGCKPEVLQQIVESKIESVVYIACNFASLVRDLRILKENYDLINVCVFDMFPCTANMETVAILKNKRGF